MLNRTFIISTLLIFAAGLTSCSPYPENPLIALGSKESRVTNTWKVSYATDEDGKVVTDEEEDTKYTFGVEGDAELTSREAGTNVTATGTWSLIEDETAIQMNFQYTVFGINFDIDLEYDILKLTQNELWLQGRTDTDVLIYLEPF